MSSSNRIRNVAIVGAGGNCGQWMARELLKTGKHTITAITRAASTSSLPEGIHHVCKVDYEDPGSLIEALRGQDALIITMGVTAPPDTQVKLIDAAAEAGVPFIMPNEWSPDTANEGLTTDVLAFATKPPIRQKIKEQTNGRCSYIAISTGFWYEWSLALTPAYGFDFDKRTAVFFDDGKTKISTSTWPQVGRAVAALLSLPIKPEGANKEKCLESLKNKQVYVKFFTISQQDMFESICRVTKTKPDHWNITHEPSVQRYADGVKAFQGGDRMGFLRMMYTRVFLP